MDPHRRGGWRKVKARFCQVCKMEEAGEVHHKKSRRSGGNDIEENLIDVCHDCHIHFISDQDDETSKRYIRGGGYKGMLVMQGVISALDCLTRDWRIPVETVEKCGGYGKMLDSLMKEVIKEVRALWQFKNKMDKFDKKNEKRNIEI